LSRVEQFSFQKVPNKVTSIQKVNIEKKGRLICPLSGIQREKFSNRKRKKDGKKGRNTRKVVREIGRNTRKRQR
jgi:hypothetical protein